MEWIELTLRPHSEDKKTPRKVMQRIDQIGDIYIDSDGYTNISPIYMKGEDYVVMESYEEVARALLKCTDTQIIPVITEKDREEELNILMQWAKQNGYDLSGIK